MHYSEHWDTLPGHCLNTFGNGLRGPWTQRISDGSKISFASCPGLTFTPPGISLHSHLIVKGQWKQKMLCGNHSQIFFHWQFFKKAWQFCLRDYITTFLLSCHHILLSQLSVIYIHDNSCQCLLLPSPWKHGKNKHDWEKNSQVTGFNTK